MLRFMAMWIQVVALIRVQPLANIQVLNMGLLPSVLMDNL